MQGLTPTTFGLIWVTLVLLSCGQVLIKLGLGKEAIAVGSNPARTILNIMSAVLRPKVLAGFSLYVVGTMVWLFVLSQVSLSVAFPLFSMSYFLVVILAATVLKERVVWKYAIVGLVLICIGVSCIGLSSPPKPNTHSVRPTAVRTSDIGHRTSDIGHRT